MSKYGETRRSDLPYFPPDRLSVSKKGERLYDPSIEEPLDETFVQDIDNRGQESAIAIWRNGRHASGPYKGEHIFLIVYGRSRWRAVIEVNRRRKARGMGPEDMLQVKCEIKQYKDMDEAEAAMIAENLQRKVVSLKEKIATVCRKLNDGWTISTISAVSKMSITEVQQYKSLSQASEKVLEAVISKKLPQAAAIELADSLSREEQDTAVDRLLAQNNLEGTSAITLAKEITKDRKPEKKKNAIKRSSRSVKAFDALIEVLEGYEPRAAAKLDLRDAIKAALCYARNDDPKELKEIFQDFGLEFPAVAEK